MGASRDLVDKIKTRVDEWELELSGVDSNEKRASMLEMLIERKNKRIGEIESVFDMHDENGMGLELVHRGGDRWAVVLDDPSEAGRFRYQEFNENGFLSHRTFDSVGETLVEAVECGFTKHDPGSLTRLSSTTQWADGMAICAVMQAMNSRMISWEDGYKELDKLDKARVERDLQIEIENNKSGVTAIQISAEILRDIDKKQEVVGGLFESYIKGDPFSYSTDRIEMRIMNECAAIESMCQLQSIYETHGIYGAGAEFIGQGDLWAKIEIKNNSSAEVRCFNEGGDRWLIESPSYRDAVEILHQNRFYIADVGAMDRLSVALEERREINSQNVLNSHERNEITTADAIKKINAFSNQNPGFSDRDDCFVKQIPSHNILKDKLSEIDLSLEKHEQKLGSFAIAMK